MKTFNIAIAGLGTVGSGVYEILKERKFLGMPIRIKSVADADKGKTRIIKDRSVQIFNSAEKLISDPNIDIVVELIGGCKIARDVVIGALKNGKTVVTANKALLAEYGEEIFSAAQKGGGDIYYEASVAGGIPIIKALREGLVANKINSIFGIVNGTSNYILSRMQEEGAEFVDVLSQAQKEGYAEKDPSFDVLGIDASHKLVILSSLAARGRINLKDVYTEGITRITHKDILYAEEFGYAIKLLAIYKNKNGEMEARVHPTLLPKNHILSRVNGVFNAIFINGDNVGEQLFYGKGAGKYPTASAVIADIVDAVRNLSSGAVRKISLTGGERNPIKVIPMEKIASQCYLRFTTVDRPGVLAKIAGVLGKHEISITSVTQKGRHKSGAVHIVMMTHSALEKNIDKALSEIDKLSITKDKTLMIRVEE